MKSTARRAVHFAVDFVEPRAISAWRINRRLPSEQPEAPPITSPPEVNHDAAIAYWQSESDRASSLLSKSTGVLAVASLSIAPATQLASTPGAPRILAALAGLYLASAVVNGLTASSPRARHTLTIEEAASSLAPLKMLEAAKANEPELIRLSNLVVGGVRDCVAAIILLLAAFFSLVTY